MQRVEVNAVVWLGAYTLSFHMSSRGCYLGGEDICLLFSSFPFHVEVPLVATAQYFLAAPSRSLRVRSSGARPSTLSQTVMGGISPGENSRAGTAMFVALAVSGGGAFRTRGVLIGAV
jgi:hypothetical protein